MSKWFLFPEICNVNWKLRPNEDCKKLVRQYWGLLLLLGLVVFIVLVSS